MKNRQDEKHNWESVMPSFQSLWEQLLGDRETGKDSLGIQQWRRDITDERSHWDSQMGGRYRWASVDRHLWAVRSRCLASRGGGDPWGGWGWRGEWRLGQGRTGAPCWGLALEAPRGAWQIYWPHQHCPQKIMLMVPKSMINSMLFLQQQKKGRMRGDQGRSCCDLDRESDNGAGRKGERCERWLQMMRHLRASGETELEKGCRGMLS